MAVFGIIILVINIIGCILNGKVYLDSGKPANFIAAIVSFITTLVVAFTLFSMLPRG